MQFQTDFGPIVHFGLEIEDFQKKGEKMSLEPFVSFNKEWQLQKEIMNILCVLTNSGSYIRKDTL